MLRHDDGMSTCAFVAQLTRYVKTLLTGRPTRDGAGMRLTRVLTGEVQGQSASTPVPVQRMAILANQGDGVTLRGSRRTRALLIAGRPLGEPIAQYGPA